MTSERISHKINHNDPENRPETGLREREFDLGDPELWIIAAAYRHRCPACGARRERWCRRNVNAPARWIGGERLHVSRVARGVLTDLDASAARAVIAGAMHAAATAAAAPRSRESGRSEQ